VLYTVQDERQVFMLSVSMHNAIERLPIMSHRIQDFAVDNQFAGFVYIQFFNSIIYAFSQKE
jgi:hypothetical protein